MLKSGSRGNEEERERERGEKQRKTMTKDLARSGGLQAVTAVHTNISPTMAKPLRGEKRALSPPPKGGRKHDDVLKVAEDAKAVHKRLSPRIAI